MATHAGYAAALTIRQKTLQDFLLILHHSNQLTHNITGGFGLFNVNLFLETPTLICSLAANNRLTLDLTARGPLTIGGGTILTRTILFRARVVVPPLLSLSAGSLIFSVDGPAAILETVDIDPLSGGALPADIVAMMESIEFKNAVQGFIRTFLTDMGQLAPPMDVSFLGNIVTAAGTTIIAKVLEGALTIGFDIHNVEGITTHGSASLLTDIASEYNLGMWTNPVALPVLMREVRTQVQTEVTEQGATLTSLNFSLIEDAIHISGSADKGSEGSVDFSMDAIPHLIRPGFHEEWEEEYGEHFEYTTPDREELWFEVANVVVDVHRPWWAYLLSVLGFFLTFGILTAFIESFIGMIRNNISSGISNSGGNAVGERVQEFTFADTTEPIIRLKIETYECHSGGVYTGITLAPQYRSPEVTGISDINVEAVVDSTIRYTLRPPFEQHPEDPMLSVRWTVRRVDTNAVIRTIDVQAATGLVLDLTGEPALLEAPELRIECRLYNTLGFTTTDLYLQTLALRIRDLLDRSHPYVMWQHEVITPVVRVEADGSHTQLGFRKKTRQSKIHRTAVPGRCRMAAQFSSCVSITDDRSPHLDYLDALPFPEDELADHRSRICDYCFFGGPDKSTPIV